MALADSDLAGRIFVPTRLPDLFLGPELWFLCSRRKLRGLLSVFGDQVGLALEGGVYGIKGEVEQKGVVPVFRDELDGVPCEAFREVFPLWAIREAGIVVGGEETARHSPAMTTDIEIKALLGGPVFRGRSEVPFPGEAGGVSCFLESFCKSYLCKVHPVVKGRGLKASTPATREEVGGIRAGRMPPGHD